MTRELCRNRVQGVQTRHKICSLDQAHDRMQRANLPAVKLPKLLMNLSATTHQQGSQEDCRRLRSLRMLTALIGEVEAKAGSAFDRLDTADFGRLGTTYTDTDPYHMIPVTATLTQHRIWRSKYTGITVSHAYRPMFSTFKIRAMVFDGPVSA